MESQDKIQDLCKMQNAFQILGLAEGAGRAEIRRAYAKLSKIYHVETDPENFSRLHAAYKTALAAAGTGNAEAADTENPNRSETSASSVRGDLGTAPAQSMVKRSGASMPSGAEKGIGTNSASSEPENDTAADSSFSKPQKNTDTNLSFPDQEKSTDTNASTTGALLDQLLGTDFSVQNCSDLTQLLYYRCRYDEISPEMNAVLLRITNTEQGITDQAQLQTSSEIMDFVPDDRKFLGIPWGSWKTLDWTCIVCHPDFYRVQYTPSFLCELYQFLSEEALNLRDGIRQELYFALCMAYGFFSSGEKSAAEPTESSPAAEIINLLRLHPKHAEYQKDLGLWPDCREAARIVLFCQKVYARFMPSAHPVSISQKADICTDTAPKDSLTLSEAAAQLLLDEEIPWKEFIYDRLADCPGGSLCAQFAKKREDFFQLCRLRREFARDFINLLDNHIEENYIYNASYLPLAIRLGRIKDCYLTRKDWKKIVCRPTLLKAFQEWLFPRRNGFSSVPCQMHYDTWKMLRTCFEGSTPFEAKGTRYLSTEYYFPEYEKRYQRELVWESAHIEEEYFRKIFPLPSLSQGKLDLLHIIEKAAPAGIQEVEKIFGNLTFDSSGLDFLTRITNAMTHFNFLLVTQKREKEAVPGDAFCFLENEVLLYRKKENLVCRLSHQVFYDLISWKFEAAAFPVCLGRTGYNEDFLNTACRNMYYYRCYVENQKNDNPAQQGTAGTIRTL